MTIVGEAELPVVPLAGTFTADLIRLASDGAQKAGAVAATEFQKQFTATLAAGGGAGKFGPAVFAGLDVEAAKAGIAGGKAYSSGFTESLRTGGAVKIVTQDPKLVTTAEASGLAGGKAYSRGFTAGSAEGNAAVGIEQQLRAAELASGASGRRAGLAFLTSFKGGLLPLAAIIATVFAVKEDTQFTATLTRIQTQAGATAGEVASVRSEILKLSPQVGIGPEALADGFYHLESAGFRGAAALSIETAAAKEARIGNADLGTTVQALIGLEAAHIKGITSAGEAVTVLNTIVGNGDLKLQDLAKSLGTGAVAASAVFGLSIQDLGGALDTLTDNTVKPQEAMTRLRMTIALIGAPSGAAIKALGTIGLSSTALGDDLRKPQGLVTALTDLENHLKSSGLTATEQAATLAHIFGGGRSSGAVDILINEMDRLKSKTDALYAATATGNKVFDDSWSVTEATTKQKLASLGAGIQVLAIELGHDLQGPVNATLNLLHDGFAAAPRVLTPVGDALKTIGGDAGVLLHDLQPVGRLLIDAFGGAVYVTVQAAAFLLRDVVHPALVAVEDTISFLGDHKQVLIGVGAAIGTILVPAVGALTADLLLDAAAWAALGLAGIVADISAAGAALAAWVVANPVLLGVAVAVGGIAAAVALVDHDTRSFTIDIDGLKTAVKDLEETGSSKPLADTILGDLSKWKPSSSSTDGITYLKNYGVAASTLSAQLADPKNLKGLQTFTDNLGALTKRIPIEVAAGSPSRGGSETIKSYTYDLAALKPYLNSTNPAVATLAGLFQKLEMNSKVAPQTISDLANEFHKLTTTTGDTERTTSAYLAAQRQLNDSGKTNLTLLKQQATASLSVSAANQLVASVNHDLVTQQDAYNKEIAKFGDVVQSQFPIFEGYQATLNLTTQDIINNLTQQLTAITNEQDNINTLASRGASPAVIAALYAKGPEWVQAAAKGTDTQLGQINNLVQTRGNDLNNLAFGVGVASGDSIIAGHVAGLEEKAQAVTIQQRAVFTKSFDTIATELNVTAGDVGRNVSDKTAQGILAGRLHVLNSMAAGLTGPAKTTVQQLEVLAANGGAGLASQLANSIANGTPLVVTKAEALKLSTNAQVQAILKEWHIKVSIDDEATQQIIALQGVITGLNNTAIKAGLGLSGFDLSKLGGLAAGGAVDGAGPKGVDSQLRVLAVGEHVLTDKDVDAMGGHGNVLAWRKSLHGMADGGPVLKGIQLTDIFNADAQVAKVKSGAALVSAATSGASIGGASVQAWASDVIQVLGLLGQPLSLLPRVLAQINTESGGNAAAINLTDSNAAKGQPSMGVLQTILTTFLANAGPFVGLGPFNGFADIYAGVNYAVHRYPGDPNHGLGYGHGYDAGGALKPGATLAINNTGAVEPILTAGQWQDIERLVAALAKLDPAGIQKLVTSGVTAAQAAISAAVKEGNGPLAVALENQLKTAEGRLYVAGLAGSANPSTSNKEAVTTAANQVATLTGQLKTLNTVNAGLVTSLNNFVSAQQQYQQTLSGAITQGNGFNDVLTASGSPADVQSVLGSKLADVKSFASKITALKARGFTSALIRDVAADGITNGTLYANLLLASTAGQVAGINAGYNALNTTQTSTANSLTQLTEGAIPGIGKSAASVFIQQAIFTSGADVNALVGKAEYAQRTAKMDSGGVLAPGRTVVDNQTGANERVLTPSQTRAWENGRGAVTIGKVENHYNGVDLRTAQAQSNRDLAIALTGARAGG